MANVNGLDKATDKTCVGIIDLLELTRKVGGDRVEIGAALERDPKPQGWLGRTWNKLTRSEPVWSGRRVYEIVPDASKRIDSVGQATQAGTGDLLATGLTPYPNSMHVVHMVGHGRGYRQSAGVAFSQFCQALQQTVAAAGRPLDLLIMESCLQGNLEALTALAPLARYALVSEDTLNGKVLGRLTTRAVRDLAERETVSARELGTTMMNQIRDDEYDFGTRPLWPTTLALVDLSKVVAPNQAAGELGHQLAKLDPNVNHTTLGQSLRMPVSNQKERERLGFGDLKQIAENAPASASAAAQKTLACLNEAVVALHADPRSHAGVGGISVQLPGPVKSYEESDYFQERDWDRFGDSRAADGWKELVKKLESTS